MLLHLLLPLAEIVLTADVSMSQPAETESEEGLLSSLSMVIVDFAGQYADRLSCLQSCLQAWIASPTGLQKTHPSRVKSASAWSQAPCSMALTCRGCCAAGFNSFFAGLAGSLPNTTFAQNNGVLALTRCASRRAGYACGVWLFLFGILAKVGDALLHV